jgi:hypothetical protein
LFFRARRPSSYSSLPLAGIIGAVGACVLVLYVFSVVRHRPDSCASLCSWLRCRSVRAPASKAEAETSENASELAESSVAKPASNESDIVELIDIRIATSHAKSAVPSSPMAGHIQAALPAPAEALPATLAASPVKIQRKKSVMPSVAAGLVEK